MVLRANGPPAVVVLPVTDPPGSASLEVRKDMAQTAAANRTWTAEDLADIAAAAYGVRVRGVEVRGLARGDNGPAVIARLADRPKDGNRSHVYSLKEASALMIALAARKAGRAGHALKVPAPFAASGRGTASPKGTPGTGSGKVRQPKRKTLPAIAASPAVPTAS